MDPKDKLSAPGRRAMRELDASEQDTSASVRMFLRGSEAFSPEQIEQLTRDGAQIRTVAGNILTAEVPVVALDQVLGHGFVVGGDVSGPLYPDTGVSGDAEPPPHLDSE